MSSSFKISVLLVTASLFTFGCGGGGGGNDAEPVANHPVEEVLSEEPPVVEPPVVEPPVTEPPVTEPPVTEPPVTEPPVTEPPATEPPVTEPPDTEPPVTEPPVTEPPVTEPPVTEPPVTEPPVTEPPVTEPPVTEPPVSEPPVTGPPIAGPPNIHNSYVIKNKAEAARFLTQATFGPTNDSIDKLIASGNFEDWIDKQFNTPATLHFPLVKTLANKMCADKDDTGQQMIDSWEVAYPRHQIWWETATGSADQLRQRVALALSEILVVSDSEGLGLGDFQYAVTSYYDVLVKHAFGNYRDLLEEVTLHPAMGDFLSMTRNRKANPEEGIRPDENYARELLQLFTIGVHELDNGGTEKLDSKGQAIPTYNQKTIEEFAKVFTGWNYAGVPWWEYFGSADHTKPLVAVEKFHDTSEKTLLNGEKTPAGQTAQADLDLALDNIFRHPNIAPFISKQLIQRLVTSNPNPAYVARVASVFNDNGSGIKGDMKAVVKAVLLDGNARLANQPASFGKLREPMLRISHLWRAFKMQRSLKTGHYWEPEKTCGQGNYEYYNFWDALDYFKAYTGQGPLQANSVFNFYRPDFSPTGLLNDNGLAAPEFQILNENTLTSTSNLFFYMIEYFSDSKATTPTLEGFSKLNLAYETSLANDTDKLLDHLGLVLLNNNMSVALRNILKAHLNKVGVYPDGAEGQLVKAREAILLISSSPEYLIQR